MSEELSTQRLLMDATDALQALHCRAVADGDKEAATAVLSLATDAAGYLADLAHGGHPADPIAEAMKGVTATADGWPITMPALEETREQALLRYVPETLGDALPFRAKQKKGRGGARKLEPGAHTYFAAITMNQLREMNLPLPSHITKETAPKWEKAGLLLAEMKCRGSWWNYPHAGIIARAESIAKTGDRRCNTPRTVIKAWLKSGFAALSRQE